MGVLASVVTGRGWRWSGRLGRIADRCGSGESGQTMVEYGLILAVVAVVVVGAIITLGHGLNGIFGSVNTDLG